MVIDIDSHEFSTLFGTIGPSGHETDIMRTWKKFFKDDSVGSRTIVPQKYAYVYPNKWSDNMRGKLLVTAHIDQFGLVVHYINDEGFVYFRPIGGWDQTVFVGQRVTMWTSRGGPQPLCGVIGRAATHLMTDEEQDKSFKIRDLWIDFGYKSKEEAKNNIEIGDVGIIEAHPPTTLPNANFTAQAIDNRIGAYISYMVGKNLIASPSQYIESVVAVNSMEEVGGFTGAHALADKIRPDFAIVIDVTLATDHPELSKERFGDIALGAGPVITVGGNMSHELVARAKRVARENNIPYQTEAIAGGSSTDADAFMTVSLNTQSLLISIPGRYLHTPVEMINLIDVDNAIKLITEICRSSDWS